LPPQPLHHSELHAKPAQPPEQYVLYPPIHALAQRSNQGGACLYKQQEQWGQQEQQWRMRWDCRACSRRRRRRPSQEGWRALLLHGYSHGCSVLRANGARGSAESEDGLSPLRQQQKLQQHLRPHLLHRQAKQRRRGHPTAKQTV